MAKNSLPKSFSIDNLEFAAVSSRMRDLSGCRFGRLTVLGFKGRDGRQWWWWCLCDCGNVCEVTGDPMRRGRTKSCGCYARERGKVQLTTHGRYGTPEYRSWQSMLTRCLNTRQKTFQRYGARGIKVCDRWLKFENFFADMGERPSLDHSLNRIDNNGNYEPNNCEWATREVQANNKRTNPLITINGVTKTIPEWCGGRGPKYARVRSRIFRLGWTPEEALELVPRMKQSWLSTQG